MADYRITKSVIQKKVRLQSGKAKIKPIYQFMIIRKYFLKMNLNQIRRWDPTRKRTHSTSQFKGAKSTYNRDYELTAETSEKPNRNELRDPTSSYQNKKFIKDGK